MISNLLTDLFKKVEGQGILSKEQASNMNKPVAGPVNVCDPNDPNYLECVQRNYQGGEGPRSNYDYEAYAPTSTIDLNEGIRSIDLGSIMSGLNPMGLSPTQKGITAVLGPMGFLGSLAYNAYKQSQERSANMAEARDLSRSAAISGARVSNRDAARGTGGGGMSNAQAAANQDAARGRY